MAQFASNPFQVVYLFSNKKKLQLKKIKVLVATFLKTEKEQVKLILIVYCI